MNTEGTIRNRLIVALDVETGEQALSLVDRLSGIAGMFKVGKQLFTAEGPAIVRRIVARGEQVFLDLKFHDIPNTVASAGVEAARLGVRMFNLHALGGRVMMERTVGAVNEVAGREGFPAPLILGVTVLTSHDAGSLREVGIPSTVDEEVLKLASLCESSGASGVVASPLEVQLIRKTIRREGFAVVVPGVRPAGADRNDQSRVMTPADAISAGASYIVVGRPIIAAPDPSAAAQKIVEEIEHTAIPDVLI